MEVSKPRVLLIKDNGEARAAISDLLNPDGYTVECVRSVQETLSKGDLEHLQD